MFNRLSRILIAGLLAVAAAAVSGCGTEGISIAAGDAPANRGAILFSQRCAGCHSISAAGARGSKPTSEVNSTDRTNGPNFNQRTEDYNSVLFAIRQGGFSGAIMPGNIVTGKDAADVAHFLNKYAGSKPN